MSGTDLNFKRGYTPPKGNAVDLNFSLNPDGEVVNGILAMVRPAPTLQISASVDPATPVTGQLTMSQPKAQLHITAVYNNDVWRGVAAERLATHQQGRHVAKPAWSSFDESAHLKPVVSSAHQQAGHLRNATVTRFKQAGSIKIADASAYQAATPLRRGTAGNWKYPPHAKVSTRDRFQEAAPLRKSTRDGFEFPAHIKVDGALVHRATQHRTNKSSDIRTVNGTKLRKSTRVPWEEANKRLTWGVDPKPPKPPEVPQYESSTLLDFICPWLDYEAFDIVLNFAKKPCNTEEPPGNTVIVPVKRVYIVLNSLMLRRVDGNIEIPAVSLSLDIDADSWTWGFNASVPASAFDALQPGSDGTPAELEVMVNGAAYRVVAERVSRDRSFAKAMIRVAGRGKAAMLDAPYAPILSFSNTEDRTAQQLMNDALTINGASIGWQVNWRLADWLVPAGAWSHQGSYISAINEIAGAAGGYVQAHQANKTLTVLPRYPVAPWSWGTVTPDFELPSAVVEREGIEWVEKPRYNRVYVSGTAQGVVGQVTRQGTAGDVLASQVVHPLITHADAARQRGLTVLGDTGRQALVSLRLPVLQETGVIHPGRLVRYVDEGEIRLGLVRSTGIEGNHPQVWQTLGVETHVA